MLCSVYSRSFSDSWIFKQNCSQSVVSYATDWSNEKSHNRRYQVSSINQARVVGSRVVVFSFTYVGVHDFVLLLIRAAATLIKFLFKLCSLETMHSLHGNNIFIAFILWDNFVFRWLHSWVCLFAWSSTTTA